MMKQARRLYNSVMFGGSMIKMHGESKSQMDDPTMAYTHKLAEALLGVMDMLKIMSTVTE